MLIDISYTIYRGLLSNKYLKMPTLKFDNGHGRIFLGKDEKTYGKEGTGFVPYDPDFECGGTGPDRQCPFETKERDIKDNPGMGLQGLGGRLFHVGIASYRDPLCPKTLFNMFTKSKHPEKLRVRVIQQNDPELDPDCLEGYCALMEKDYKEGKSKADLIQPFTCPYASQVFIHQVHAKEARGPTFARSLLSEDVAIAYSEGKVHQQDFCLSIDSHMDFEPMFDEALVGMFDMIHNEYAVLSTYVAGTEQLGVNLGGVNEVPHLCMVTFTSSVRTHATKMAQNLSRPKLTNSVYGAGLAFSKCHAEIKVPVDPHTPGIFDGEEFNRGARFFTHGYDIYTPHRVFVLHNYEDSQKNPVTASWWRQIDREAEKESNKRLNALLDVPLYGGNILTQEEKLKLRQSKYGLGDRRSLDQLIEFSGIDLRHAKPSVDGKNRCGNIRWVPFIEHTEGVNYVPKFDNEENPLEGYSEGSIYFPGKPIGWNGGKAPLEPQNAAKQDTMGKLTLPDNSNALPVLTSAEKLGQKLEEKRALRAATNVDGPFHAFISGQPHPPGFRQLPFLVQGSVVFLVLGMISSLVFSAITGGGRKNRKVKKLRSV